jgi:hypothetical protein
MYFHGNDIGNLPPAQRLKNVYGPILRDTIRERLSIDHYRVVDAEIDVPAQRAAFVQDVIREPWGNLVDRTQNLGDRAGWHGNRTVFKRRKEPVEVASHFDRRHGVQPNRTE